MTDVYPSVELGHIVGEAISEVMQKAFILCVGKASHDLQVR